MPVYGITIPVFLRRGRLEAAAALAGPHLVQSPAGSYIELDLSRSGQRSIFGEMIVKTADGALLFNLRGIAIYPEITHRKVRLSIPAEVLPRVKGRIKIEYRELPENGGALLAETTANLP